MPSIPVSLGSPIIGGDLPVSTIADVNAVLPLILAPDDPAPVRDAMFAALTEILLRYQRRASVAIGQTDILTATGAYLRQACSDVGVFAQVGETEDALRARALLSPALVTPTAVMAAVNSLLAPFTSILARYSETLGDRFCVYSESDVAPTVLAYVYSESSIPRSPDYPDRYYQSEAAQNGGFAVPGREPGAARVFSDTVGREFLLRVPDLSSLDIQIASVYRGTTPRGAFYCGTGTSPTNTTFVRALTATSSAVYGQIVNVVNRIKGASMRWILLVDPKLVS